MISMFLLLTTQWPLCNLSSLLPFRILGLLVGHYKQAVINAKEAGFDGVEHEQPAFD